MDKINQLSNFIERIFDLYHLNKFGFFYESDDDTFEEYEIPLFPEEKIDDRIIKKLSIKLGLEPFEILGMDDAVMYKYWNKYPFFNLYDLFLNTWEWNSQYKEKVITPSILLNSIFYDEETIPYPAEERYNYKAVKERLVKQLKEINVFMPGTYHPNAKITNLTIKTEVLFSFPEITEMLQSYIDMINKVEDFFFKALDKNLSSDEINEYNFLVNALQITDIVMPNTLITYDNVCKYKDAYLEENLNNFFSYATVRGFVGTGALCPGVNPWRCKEFFDDMELVNKLAYIFPEIKEQMRKFAIQVKKFKCDFVWSDAEYIRYSESEEQELIDCGMYIPIEERSKEHTVIYVDKVKEELYDWSSYIEKISVVASPTAKGGIRVRSADINSSFPHNIKRIQRRIELKNGGNV